jgi:hypothetical protein
MAKRSKNVANIRQAELKIGTQIVTVSANLVAMIAGLKAQFGKFTELYTRLTESKAEFAEKFMSGFTLFAQETGRTFVDYVRAIDPTVPQDREGYRSHRSYQAADYLRRSMTVGGGNRGARQKPARTNAVGRLARMIATILAIVRPEDHAAVWQGVADEFGLAGKALSNLKTQAGKVEPLFMLPVRRPVPAGKVIHMEEARAIERAA